MILYHIHVIYILHTYYTHLTYILYTYYTHIIIYTYYTYTNCVHLQQLEWCRPHLNEIESLAPSPAPWNKICG